MKKKMQEIIKEKVDHIKKFQLNQKNLESMSKNGLALQESVL